MMFLLLLVGGGDCDIAGWLMTAAGVVVTFDRYHSCAALSHLI